MQKYSVFFIPPNIFAKNFKFISKKRHYGCVGMYETLFYGSGRSCPVCHKGVSGMSAMAYLSA